MDLKQKILVSGDTEGKFNTLFDRVEAINKKSGPFDLLLCVGNFFGINNKEFNLYKSGLKKGKRGLYTNSNGLKIAYLSGIASTDSSKAPHTYSLEDAIFLRDVCKKGNPNFKGVDILITSEWPSGVMKFHNSIPKENCTMHTDIVAWLDLQLKPRYHFSGLEGVFYERPPFRSLNAPENDSSVEPATRFLALARVGNPNKYKWLYAVSLTPLDKMNFKELLQKTTDETECPFNLIMLENILFKTKKRAQPINSYFYMSSLEQETIGEKTKRPKVEFDQNKCWFCLASPSVQKHLVLTVGNLVYIALAKGGLVDDHFLICPVEHYQSTITISEDVLKELKLFKEALTKFYKISGKVPVFFERNYKTSHMQIQVIPVPKSATKDLKEIFKDEAEGHGFKLEELDADCKLKQAIQAKVPYFVAELPNKTILYTKIQPSMNFPINFGREVLATGPILNLPDRIDWRDCNLSKVDEEALVKSLRNKFKPFDVTT